ncbi:MAG: hypothetical protein NZ556_06185 [Fimbriimonadales bacterium]|nr:hypothetical protein [Fimbriimonadales bacterium]
MPKRSVGKMPTLRHGQDCPCHEKGGLGVLAQAQRRRDADATQVFRIDRVVCACTGEAPVPRR